VRDARGQEGAVDAAIAVIDALLLDAVEDDMRQAMRLGVFRRADRRRVAQFYLGGIEKLALSSLASDQPFDRESLVADVVDFELFGLMNDERRARPKEQRR